MPRGERYDADLGVIMRPPADDACCCNCAMPRKLAVLEAESGVAVVPCSCATEARIDERLRLKRARSTDVGVSGAVRSILAVRLSCVASDGRGSEAELECALLAISSMCSLLALLPDGATGLAPLLGAGEADPPGDRGGVTLPERGSVRLDDDTDEKPDSDGLVVEEEAEVAEVGDAVAAAFELPLLGSRLTER